MSKVRSILVEATLEDMFPLSDYNKNPINPSEYVTKADPIGAIQAEMTGPVNMWIHSIRALKKGGGTTVLKLITRKADEHGVTLTLIAEPYDAKGVESPLSRTALIEWYKQYGFIETHQDMMV